MALSHDPAKMQDRSITLRVVATLVCALALGLVIAGHASAVGITEVKIEGTGTGTVNSNPSGIDCTDTGGTMSGECTNSEFPFFSHVELTATSGPGSQFEGWRGSENTAECETGTANPCSYTEGFLTYEVTAIFGSTGPQQPLEVRLGGSGGGEVASSPEGIECGSKCEAEFSEDSTVVLTAMPNAHSTFAEWAGCGAVTSENKCEVAMSEAKTVAAKFDAIPQQTLEVLKTGTGTGEVNSSPGGIECGAMCNAHFNEGSTVILTATPSAAVPGSRYTFAGWKGCDAVNGEGNCEVTMSQVKVVEAEFDENPQQTIKVEKAGSGDGEVTSSPGGISCGGTCEAEFDEGAVVTLTETPSPGSFFAGWAGGCSGAGACEVTLSARTTVTADFEPIPSPSASTGEATSITDTAATLEGLVDGQGYDTHYLVEYGESESYGSEAPTNNGVGEDAGVLATSSTVTVGLSELTPNTTYHYKIIAYNVPCSFFCPPSGPNTAYGADRTFTTLPAIPSVTTSVPVSAGTANATLAGEVIAQGADTLFHLEYGATEALGTSTASQEAGSSTGGVYVTASIEALAPNTTYFYRFAARNSGGEGHGEIQSFTTSAAGQPSTGPLPSGFSLTGASLAGVTPIGFPDLSRLEPVMVAGANTRPTTAKPLTRAQRLAKALKSCAHKKSRSTRSRCESRARSLYGIHRKSATRQD